MSISGKTRLAGVIGWPIEHTLSPAMQNAAIAQLGLDWAYVAMPVRPEALAAAIAGARALGFAGLNVTIPHKEAALACVDTLEPAARAIGAINTIHFTPDRTIGANTDAPGYTRTVIADGDFEFSGATILQIGGGGAGRAMVAGAAEAGARRVMLYDIDAARLARLAADMAGNYPETRFEIIEGAQALVAAAREAQLVANATPLGMKPEDPMPIPAEALHAGQVVFDAVYVPAETKLLAAARAAGARPVGGLGMLARQGARSLRMWTRGVTEAEPDEALMIRVLRQKLGV